MRELNPAVEYVWCVFTWSSDDGSSALSWFKTEAEARTAAKGLEDLWSWVTVARAYCRGGLSSGSLP